MNERTRICPECNRPIYKYAQICPYCKCETMFSSVDEETDMLEGEEQVGPADDLVEEPVAETEEEVVETSADDGNADGEEVPEKHHHAVIDQLKHETEVVKKEFDEKIGKRFSTSTIIISTVIILLSFAVLGIYIAVRMMEQETLSLNDQVDNSLKEVVDSMEMELYQSLAARNPGNTEFGLYRLSADDMSLEIIDKGRVAHEKDEYVVTTDLRRATYDANGDRLTGVSGANGEPVMPTVTKPEEKPKTQVEHRKEAKKPEVVNESKPEVIIPKADIVPKPTVTDLQEKIEIKPVKPAGE